MTTVKTMRICLKAEYRRQPSTLSPVKLKIEICRTDVSAGWVSDENCLTNMLPTNAM
jgi:hypothetical protein